MLGGPLMGLFALGILVPFANSIVSIKDEHIYVKSTFPTTVAFLQFFSIVKLWFL